MENLTGGTPPVRYLPCVVPCKLYFHEVEAVEEEGAIVIRFDNEWFRTIDDFFQKAELDGELLTTRYEELYDFEVI